MNKREVKLAVISDVHLGTYGCHAAELNRYLKSIRPEILVINGDFIDGWQLSKTYFPETHWKVIKRIINLMMDGTQVYYLTGNHDEVLRKFSGLQLANFHLEDKLVLNIDGKTCWFFHGDVFDITMRHSKWLAKIGSKGYDLLILLNRAVNLFLEKTGREKISLSKKVKDKVKAAVKHISHFERTAAEISVHNRYDYVICGHIHEPVMKEYAFTTGNTVYLNSGDWVENLTALEYNHGKWELVYYKNLHLDDDTDADLSIHQPSADIVELQSAFIRITEISKTGS
ncbi:MAG: UDP-2,3-diacylglucosamine diphosphatase [Chitinophagales bacterium]|nr:UDP-2,3-diacylglucosamine diphosphatase [Chitinophagales bacterium]